MTATATHYLVLAMRGPAFDAAMVAPHVAWLEELHARGLLAMTGGFSDGTGGAYVLQGIASLQEAQALVATDPLAVSGSSQLTVREWNTR